MDRNSAWVEEEQNKEEIYRSFEQSRNNAAESLRMQEQYYRSGQYEDQDAFIAAGAFSHAQKEKYRIDQEIKTLYDKPYFAHVRMTDKEEDQPKDFFLSDNEWLDQAVSINGSDSCIIPFKYMPERPLLDKVRIFYTAPSDKDINVVVNAHGVRYSYIYKPNLVRNIDIFRRELRNVETTFSDVPEEELSEEYIDSDELLAQRLQENRTNAQLRNIISTLQKQQFEIIQTDIGISFIVQGCAGSGKTQCMIHRLFFLRESLSQRGWEKVLLITPTQLFRNYSSNLMRRYRLTDIANYSLAEFYCYLLENFDSRFRNRQYQFELTEEYLPDVYLQQVYAPEQIKTIENEIQNAIYNHLLEGCRLLDITIDENTKINIDFVNTIAKKLSDEIQRFDETEKMMSDDPEYREHRAALDELDKQLKTLQRKQNDLLQTKEKLEANKARFEQLQHDVEKAKAEVDEWKKMSDDKISSVIQELNKYREVADSASSRHDLSIAAAKYAVALFRANDITNPNGKTTKEAKDYLELLLDIVQENQDKLTAFTKKQTPGTWLRNHEQRYQMNLEQLGDIATEIELNILYQDDHSNWLQAHHVEDARKQRQAHRATLERTRYYLSRIESSVFEQEVWNALAPLKEKCGIKTMVTEQIADGHQKQTRILYKSDLLFYLKIYTALHTVKALPDFSLICIDEGQDLHKADYKILQDIYPRAVLNIFGDIDQVLHESCGISEWQSETEVETIYDMNNNYRNTPAIVDFCNKRFSINMKYCGLIKNDQKPTVITDSDLLKRTVHKGVDVVIVKDKKTFEMLCETLGPLSDNLEYIDTKSADVTPGKTSCYSIFAAKGLEFSSALVYARNMTNNQKIVACTRAMNHLFYAE